MALVVLGPKRLGQTSQSTGRTIRGIQEHKEEFKEKLMDMFDEDEPNEKCSEKESLEKKAVKESESQKKGQTLMGFPGLESPTHLLLILLVILLLFGARRIPELAKSLGRGINEFKEGLNFKDEPAAGEERSSEEALEGERAGAAPAAGGGVIRAVVSEGEKAYGEQRRRQEGA